jgi:putative ABC transport system permease protein
VTALAPRAALGGRRNGGVAARRAMVRWAGRMFRREWRQQLLVVALLVAAVTGAVASITIGYNASAADDSEFGSANHLLRLDGADPRRLATTLAAARRRFGTTEAVGHRTYAVPGGVERIDVRAQDPGGALGGSLLAIRRGHYPTGAGEVAVTDGVARLLRLDIGSTWAVDGVRRKVVGIVENPRRLSDEFALVPRSSAGKPEQITLMVNASAGAVRAFQDSLRDGELAGIESRGNEQQARTLALFSVATVFLLLACLVAAAGFAVVAQRRLRQLGMLTAIGATPKHLRLVLVANGALAGLLAAVTGTIAGLALWVLAGPTLETAVDHRIDRLSIPWPLVVAAAVLAVVGAAGAAWWPGRSAARVPVMLALSGRPPKPRPARHAAIAAAVLIAAGLVCLALSDRERRPLIVTGILASTFGCMLLGPPAIRVLGRVAGRAPIAPRLAMRDLVRYQARSGAALAAVGLALGIAATAVIVGTAEKAKRAAEPPNLSDRQIRVLLGPPEIREAIPAQALDGLDRQAAGVRRLAGELDHAAVTPLRKVVAPGVRPFFDPVSHTRLLPAIQPARKLPGPMYRFAAQLYVATPEVLRYLGVDPTTVAPGTDFLAGRNVPVGRLVMPSFDDRRDVRLTNVQRIDVGSHLFGAPDGLDPRSLTFITVDGLRRLGFKPVPAGWLVESRRPLTSEQIADARSVAAKSGLTLEVRRRPPSFDTTLAIVMCAAALLALAVLALTVGLIRGESAGDLRTLTATGAGSRVRRSLTATTAGALGILGALLGVAGAYLVLVATYHDDLGYLSSVPVLYLVGAVIGVPLAAAGAGWLLAGREPPAIARSVIE